MDDFDSLSRALERWFEADLDTLPDALRTRVLRDFLPMAWGELEPEQRRSFAAQWDEQHDPALEGARQEGWDRFWEMSDLEDQIERWESVAAPTAKDLDIKEAKLVELRRALARVNTPLRAGTSAPVAATRRHG